MDHKLLIDTIRTMTVILGGLVIGYGLRKSGHARPGLAAAVNRIVLTYIQPFVICLALWAMPRPDLRTLALPLFGASMVILMWPVAALIPRLLRMDRRTSGSFVTSAIFSNVGFTYGTFVAFAALGPPGAALGALYCASFMPTFFTLGFYVGKRYSVGEHQGVLQAAIGLARDGQTRNPILGIVMGLLLNLLGVGAPGEAAFIIDFAMPTTTAAFLLAIGLGLRLSAVKQYWRECLLMHAVKFAVSPIIGLALALVFGYWQVPDHSVLRVVVIQSAAPCAIMAVMLSDVFDLNRELAGAVWLTTNVTAILLAPILLLIVRAL